MNLKLALLVLVLASLACGQQVTTPTASPSPLPSPTVTDTLPHATETIPAPAAAETEWIGFVRQPVVNIHETPGGVVRTDVWLSAGAVVKILRCVDEWCEIQEPAGWIWRGCLEGAQSSLGCEADK
jgi:hypothetical protein